MLLVLAACGGEEAAPPKPDGPRIATSDRPVAAVAEEAVSARRALVIGNTDYRSYPDLPNAVPDARLVASALSRIGFEVRDAFDLDLAGTEAAIAAHFAALAPGDLNLVYYAGHAAQVGGTNYLAPVDAPAGGDPAAVLGRFVSLDGLIARIEASPARRSIVVLDGCRDNPFVFGAPEGLAPPPPIYDRPFELLLLYAAAPGRRALDAELLADTGHSPFSTAFATWVGTPGLDLDAMVQSVIRDVSARTEGFQVPWTTNNFTGPVVLNPERRLSPRPTPAGFADLAGQGDLGLKPEIWGVIEGHRAESRGDAELKGVRNTRFVALATDGSNLAVRWCNEEAGLACDEPLLARAAVESCERKGKRCGLYAAIRSGVVDQIWQGRVGPAAVSRLDTRQSRIELVWAGLGPVLGSFAAPGTGPGEMRLTVAGTGEGCRATYLFDASGRDAAFNGVCDGGLTFTGTLHRTSEGRFDVEGTDRLGRPIGGFAVAG